MSSSVYVLVTNHIHVSCHALGGPDSLINYFLFYNTILLYCGIIHKRVKEHENIYTMNTHDQTIHKFGTKTIEKKHTMANKF